MGQTSKYGLRYPSGGDLVIQGPAAIQTLAQDVELALQLPYLVTKGSGDIAWATDKTGLVPWDLAAALAVRGDFGAGSSTNITPPKLGLYLITTSVRFGGKSEGDVFGVHIETEIVGNPSVTLWTQQQIEVADTSSAYTQLSVSAVVPITQADQSVRILAKYLGTNVPPQPSSPTVHRFAMYCLGLL